jgi:pantoate--beta-alanine ligase
MVILKSASDIQQLLHQKTRVGFVPTMGALHEGHLSLIRRSKKEDSFTVCSIFVNPTQFNNKKDFEKYPITISHDVDMLEKAGCDLLFLPTVMEMYPEGTDPKIKYELGYLETILEGAYRPGHFQGVCQVVDRLLQIVPADRMYLGQKDYQQCMVLKKMIAEKHPRTEVVVSSTMRESDGLAMSSRNMRLNEQERKLAVKISDTLTFIKDNLKNGYLNDLKERARNFLTTEGFKVDYVEIANADTLEAMENNDGKTKLVALIAAYIGDVRLIDNLLLTS